MRVLLVFLFLVLSASASVKIASYNVNNLFDGKNDGSEYDDYKKGGKKKWNEQKYQKKLKQVCADVKAINADVILLLEIENDAVLRALANCSGYDYRIFANGNDEAPVGLGFLSRIKINNYKSFIVPRVKTRPILQINISDAGRSLNLFGAHFPAIKNSFEKRLNAAKTMQRAVHGVKNAIILGDLNSNYDKDFLLRDNLKDFTSIWEQVKNKKSYKHGGTLDHIMLSNDLFKAIRAKFEVIENTSSDHFALSVSF